MKKILCFFSFHKWWYRGTPRGKLYPERVCKHCKLVQEGTYDMTYGCTNWLDK